jgi:alanine racemase
MNRLGFHERELNELCVRLSNDRQVEVASIFSHLAASENPKEDAFTLPADRGLRAHEHIAS